MLVFLKIKFRLRFDLGTDELLKDFRFKSVHKVAIKRTCLLILIYNHNVNIKDMVGLRIVLY